METNSEIGKQLMKAGFMLKLEGKSDQRIIQFYQSKGLSLEESSSLMSAINAQMKEIEERSKQKVVYDKFPLNWSWRVYLGFGIALFSLIWGLFIIAPMTYAAYGLWLVAFWGILFLLGLIFGFHSLYTPSDYDSWDEQRILGRHRMSGWMFIPGIAFMIAMGVWNSNKVDAFVYSNSILTIAEVIGGVSETSSGWSIGRRGRAHNTSTTENRISIKYLDEKSEYQYLNLLVSSSEFNSIYQNEPVVFAYLSKSPNLSRIVLDQNQANLYTGAKTESFIELGPTLLSGEFSKEKLLKEEAIKRKEAIQNAMQKNATQEEATRGR